MQRISSFSFLVLMASLFLVGCDGFFRVKQDVELRVNPTQDCVRKSIQKVLPETDIVSRKYETGEALEFYWKGPSGFTTGQAFFPTNVEKPGIELSTGGVVAPYQKLIKRYKEEGTELLKKMAKEIETSCNRIASVTEAKAKPEVKSKPKSEPKPESAPGLKSKPEQESKSE